MVRGVRHHDHGEVWHRPWRILEAVNRLWLSIDLPVSGLRCERSIAVEGDGLRLDWRITNPKNHPVPYLWCWHPLFAWRPGDRLELPGVQHVLERWVRGTVQRDWPLAWPGADLSAGLLGDKPFSKSFVRSNGLAIMRSGHAGLEIRWDPLVLPWAGLWIKHDEGLHQWAIEPTTVNSDWLGKLNVIPPESILPAHGERSWSIRLQPR